MTLPKTIRERDKVENKTDINKRPDRDEDEYPGTRIDTRFPRAKIIEKYGDKDDI